VKRYVLAFRALAAIPDAGDRSAFEDAIG